MEEEILEILNYWLCNENYEVEYSGKVGVFMDIKAKAKSGKSKKDWKVIIDRDADGNITCKATTELSVLAG